MSFINDRGEIAATGVLANGDQHAILLVPCEDMESDKGCKGDEDAANTAGKIIETSIARTSLPATQPNLPLIEGKDRFRTLWTKRRFRAYPQK